VAPWTNLVKARVTAGFVVFPGVIKRFLLVAGSKAGWMVDWVTVEDKDGGLLLLV